MSGNERKADCGRRNARFKQRGKRSGQGRLFINLEERRRRLEAGEVATIHDLAKAEGFTDRFVSRMVRLAYLSPDVLEGLVISRDPPSVSVNELMV